MAGALDSLIAKMNMAQMTGGPALPLPGPATPPIAGQAPQGQKPLSLEDLLREYMGKKELVPTEPYQQYAQSYAPGGPQLNFTGGSPFPVDERPAIINNALVGIGEMAKVLGELRKKQAAAKATKKAEPGSAKQ
jgi:hypothetical protein